MTVLHIVVAMKPVEGNYAGNALEYGVSGVNIDGSRIEGMKPSVPQPMGGSGDIYGFKNGEGRNGKMSDNSKGRWPANVILDGSDEVKAEFPCTHGAGNVRDTNHKKGNNIYQGEFKPLNDNPNYHSNNGGSAERFFKKCKGEGNE